MGSVVADDVPRPTARRLDLNAAEDVAVLADALVSLASLDESTLGGSLYRPVRAALEPLHRRFAARQNAILERARKNQLRKEAEARAKRRAHQDKKHRDTTQLRLGRIRNLAELCENDGGGGGQPIAGLLLPGGGGGEGSGDETRITSYLSQVPDGAVRESSPDSSSRDVVARAALGPGTTDAVGGVGGDEAAENPSGGGGGETPELYAARQCYACKARFSQLHVFYAQLCPTCAEVNYAMRHLSCDLTGRVALLTGARVKIGFEVGLKLLRAGATLYATTRFPADCLARYEKEEDFAEWSGRLHVHAVDLRDVAGLERFCAYLLETSPRLDVIVNNACQTVRRPASYYAHLLPSERALDKATRGMTACAPHRLLSAGDEKASTTSGTSGTTSTDFEDVPDPLARHAARVEAEREHRLRAPELLGAGTAASESASAGARVAGGSLDDPEFFPSPAELSALKLAPEDSAYATGAPELPLGKLDVNGQQIDLRSTNSWTLKLEEVSLPELVEVMAVNSIAPFVLNARLQPLLARSAANPPLPILDDSGKPPRSRAEASPGRRRGAYVVNVSAMEGKFYRHKTPNHPHTNMAKAALNMMTRTSAAELAEKHEVYMTAVDTGWINDENPREKAARTARVHHFQTPLDEIDAAARVLHPVFHGIGSGAEPLRGVFLKDFVETEW